MKKIDYVIIGSVLLGVGGSIYYLWRRNKKQLEEQQLKNQQQPVAETVIETAPTSAGTPSQTTVLAETVKKTGVSALSNILSYLANPPKTTAAKRVNLTEVSSPAQSLAPARMKGSTLLGFVKC